ncbi:MAG: hypothetical protein EP344_02825 [Bacteroidetes bacterium]|nr:MAG: hypothetical protein EP344_02825 [Bacteroidota bacterium]
MKKTPIYTIGYLLYGLLASPPGVSGQALDAVPGVPTETIRFQASALPDLYAFDDPVETHYPYWQIFWMYGDGNHYYNEGEMGFSGSSELPPPTLPYESTHQYLSVALAYDPAAILIDRKTDTPPPSVANIVYPNPGNITMPAPVAITPVGTHPSGYDFIRFSSTSPAQLPVDAGTCERVSLDISHYVDNERWVAFIPAFKPLAQPGKLLFFFDHNSGAPQFANTFQTFGPRYGPVDLVDNSLVQTAASYAIPPGSGTYGRVLEYDIPDNGGQSLWLIDNMNDGREEELRLYHFLRALSIPTGTPLQCMVVLVTNDPPADPAFSACIDANYDNDQSFISDYVDANKQIRVRDSIYYYVDAARLQVEHGEPVDPNRLVVTKICECPGSNYYQVTFELTFCNISDWPTESASIFIEDLTGGNIRCFLADEAGSNLGVSGAVQAANGAGCTPLCMHNKDCRDIIQFPGKRNGNFCLIYDPIATGLPDNCRTFSFTAITNLAGLTAIQQGEAVRGCVNFHETRCEILCALSDSTSIDPKGNTCLEPCPDCCFSLLCDWEIIGGILVVAVAALIFLWYKGWPPFRPKS